MPSPQFSPKGGGREAPGDGSPLVERTEHRSSKAESAVIANLDEIET